MSDDYAARQAVRNARARADYAALLPTLDPAVRAILETTDRKTGRKHVDMADSFCGSHAPHDAAELPEPSVLPDMAAAVDTLSDELQERFGLTPRQAAQVALWHRAEVALESRRQQGVMLIRTLGTLLRVENLKQELYALLYATGTAASNGLGSMRQTCKTILKPDGTPVTVASLSKRQCWWKGFLGLPPVEGMKKPAVVEGYVASARRGHETRQSKKMAAALARLAAGNPTNA